MALNEALRELVADKAGCSWARLIALSDLSPEEMPTFIAAWSASRPERRRHIIATLVELAEENVQLDFTAVFRHALQDEDEEVRAAAVAGLWECEDRSLIDPLVRLLQNDPAERVRAAAAQALGRFALLAETGKLRPADGQRVSKALLDVLDDDAEALEVRRRAIEAIAPMSLPRVPMVIQEAYEHDDDKVRASALFAMGRTCDPRWLPILTKELSNSDPEMRYEAATALGEMGEDSAILDLIPLINDPDPQVQTAVLNALGAIGGPVAKKVLLRATQSADPHVSETAEAALQSIVREEDPFGPDAN